MISENPNLCWNSGYSGVTTTLPMKATVMMDAIATSAGRLCTRPVDWLITLNLRTMSDICARLRTWVWNSK